MKEQLIQGSTQDWYALLLRSQFPTLIQDVLPWNIDHKDSFLQSLKQTQSLPQNTDDHLQKTLQSQNAQQLFAWQRKQLLNILQADDSSMQESIFSSVKTVPQDMSIQDVWHWSNSMNHYYAGIKSALSKQAATLRTPPSIDH